MQKYLKNNKGFTLVEVIVVAVIVLVLAAVAIPLYNGYIKDSRRNVASNNAASMASALVAAVQSGDVIAGTWPTYAFSGATGPNSEQVFRLYKGNSNTGANLVEIMIPKGYFASGDATTVTVCYGTTTANADLVNGECGQAVWNLTQ